MNADEDRAPKSLRLGCPAACAVLGAALVCAALLISEPAGAAPHGRAHRVHSHVAGPAHDRTCPPKPHRTPPRSPSPRPTPTPPKPPDAETDAAPAEPVGAEIDARATEAVRAGQHATHRAHRDAEAPCRRDSAPPDPRVTGHRGRPADLAPDQRRTQAAQLAGTAPRSRSGAGVAAGRGAGRRRPHSAGPGGRRRGSGSAAVAAAHRSRHIGRAGAVGSPVGAAAGAPAVDARHRGDRRPGRRVRRLRERGGTPPPGLSRTAAPDRSDWASVRCAGTLNGFDPPDRRPHRASPSRPSCRSGRTPPAADRPRPNSP